MRLRRGLSMTPPPAPDAPGEHSSARPVVLTVTCNVPLVALCAITSGPLAMVADARTGL